MDEYTATLPTASIAAYPAAGAPAITQVLIPHKAVLKHCLIEIAGQYDQSVGAETMATEGNLALIDEVRLNLQGQARRQMKGPMLYELNRLIARGAAPQTDPATGVATGKLFNVALFFDMNMFDTLPDVEPVVTPQGGIAWSYRDLQAKTNLDLRNWPGLNYLEIVWKTFASYVSGNTQANMAINSVRVTPLLLTGAARINPPDQLHAEMVIQDTVDMSITGVDRFSNLLRDATYSRGLLCRVGQLAATPIVTGFTPLSLIGLKGNFKSGPAVTWKDKLPPATFQKMAGWDRNNVALRAGYVLLDHSSDFSYGGGVDGNRLAVYQNVYDVTGTATWTMQVAQLVVRK